jgi:nicotinamide mononucleotide adenylyltransferase
MSSITKNSSHIPFHKFSLLSNNKPPAVLVACGSYSPITNLHLRIFEQAKNYLMYEKPSLDVIGGIISPVHDLYGKKSLIKDVHRVAMCEAAVADNDWIGVCSWEINQAQWSRTALTLTNYHETISNSKFYDTKVSVILLCGADLLESILIPNLWAEEDLELILGLHGVAVIERIGLDLKQLIANTAILKKYEKNIYIIPQTISNNISSTSVRTLLANNLSVKYLIPDRVIEYIHKNELYGYRLNFNQQTPLIQPNHHNGNGSSN